MLVCLTVYFCSDIFDAMFFVKKEVGEVIIQQGMYVTMEINVHT